MAQSFQNVLELVYELSAHQVQELVYDLDVLELVQSQEYQLVLAVQSHMVVWTEHLSATVHLLGVRHADHASAKSHHLVHCSSMSVPSHLVQGSSRLSVAMPWTRPIVTACHNLCGIGRLPL